MYSATFNDEVMKFASQFVGSFVPFTIKKEALKLKKASGVPNKEKVGKLTQAQLTEIAEKKMPDLNANDIEAAKKIIAGTARSMGVEVE